MVNAEWAEVFSTIDDNASGSIPTTKLGLCIRACGGYPTEEEVKKMCEKADPKNTGKVNLEEFSKQMEWCLEKSPLEMEPVMKAFKMFDKDDNGTISKIELAHVLASMGDKLSTEEADEFVKEANVDSEGMIKYEEFLKMIID